MTRKRQADTKMHTLATQRCTRRRPFQTGVEEREPIRQYFESMTQRDTRQTPLQQQKLKEFPCQQSANCQPLRLGSTN